MTRIYLSFLAFLFTRLLFSQVSEPVFSVKAGFYDSSISIQITPVNVNDLVYYTLNGSKPNANSTKYSIPISINKTTVVKAASSLGTSMSFA